MAENEMSEQALVVIGGVKRAAEVAQTAAVATGEPVVVVARINKIHPSADVLVTTATWMLTGLAPGLGRKTPTWTVRLSGRDLLSVDTNRRHVVVQTPAGVVRLGDVYEQAERDQVVAQLRALQERCAGKAGQDADVGQDADAGREAQPATEGLAEVMASFLTQDEWPTAGASQLRLIAVCLRYAQQYAASGDVVAEERNLWDARRAADKAGLAARKVRKRIDVEVAALEAAGRVRSGSRVLGEVKSKDLVAGSRLVVRSDRVLLLANGQMQCRALDADVVAAVEIDGQVFESSRPTLTRMALGAPLPGSALLMGMAAQKRERRDERTALFGIVHPQWQMAVRVDPNTASGLRPLAAQVNATAAAAGRAPAPVRAPGPDRPVAARAPAQPVVPAAVADGGMQAVRVQLEEIERMRVEGLIDDAEAAVLRKRALS